MREARRGDLRRGGAQKANVLHGSVGDVSANCPGARRLTFRRAGLPAALVSRASFQDVLLGAGVSCPARARRIAAKHANLRNVRITELFTDAAATARRARRIRQRLGAIFWSWTGRSSLPSRFGEALA
jgi:hypothetical protein